MTFFSYLSLPFLFPFPSGPASSGKSSTALDIILNRHRIIDKPINFVVYVYVHWQDNFNQVMARDTSVVFVNKKETANILINNADNPSLVVFDDLQVEWGVARGANFLTDWMIKRSSHLNCSLICMTHSLFPKLLVTAMQSNSYLVLHKNNRDRSQVIWLGRQLIPFEGGSRFVYKSYVDAVTSRLYGICFVDTTPFRPNDACAIRNFVYPFINSKYYVPQVSVDGKLAMSILRVVPEPTYNQLVEEGILNEKNMGLDPFLGPPPTSGSPILEPVHPVPVEMADADMDISDTIEDKSDFAELASSFNLESEQEGQGLAAEPPILTHVTSNDGGTQTGLKPIKNSLPWETFEDLFVIDEDTRW